MGCCHGCTRRTAICHGRNEDGTWRCNDWRLEEEAKARERAEKQEALRKALVRQEYFSESRARFLRRKRNKHEGR